MCVSITTMIACNPLFPGVYYNHDMTDVGKIAIRSAVVKRPPHLTAKCDLRVAV